MAKVQVAGGQELELVTPGDLRAILGELFPSRQGPETVWPLEAVELDASGDGSVDLYTVRAAPGWELALHRVTIDVDGYTPAAPYTNASGYAELLRAGGMVEFVNFSAAAGGLPAVKTWGESSAIRYRSGEPVVVSIVGGPANGVVVVRGQGTLQPPTLG